MWITGCLEKFTKDLLKKWCSVQVFMGISHLEKEKVVFQAKKRCIYKVISYGKR